MMPDAELESLELELLIEAIFRRYGYDFRGYSRASLTRRVRKRLATTGLASISALQHQILYDPPSFDALLLDLSINVTEMFRDPFVFRALREQVLPALADREVIKVWHAGCSTGEEVYSMAILLEEAGLADRARIYATDHNQVVLAKARDGVFPANRLKEYTASYQQSGGTRSFADYYTARYELAVMSQSLRRRIAFADHNLTTDGVFGEMDLVVCRNVLIYFGRELQDRVLRLFSESLTEGGFLCIGTKESVAFSPCAKDFEVFAGSERIYRKVPTAASAGSREPAWRRQ